MFKISNFSNIGVVWAKYDDGLIILTAIFCILNNDDMYLSHVLPHTSMQLHIYGIKKNYYTELVKLTI